MLWGCFSSKDPGNLVRVHGIMNGMDYQEFVFFESGCPCQETTTGSLLDLPAGQWSKT